MKVEIKQVMCLVVREDKKCPVHSIWAASWQNQQNDRAPSEDSDQPGYPQSDQSVGPALNE